MRESQRMRRIPSALLLCLFALSLQAAGIGQGDFAISSLAVDQAEAQTGAPITLRIGVKAIGPSDSIDINLQFFNSWAEPLNPLSATVPQGWQCSPVFANCWATTMAAGTEAQIVLQLTTPPVARQNAFTITAHASSGNEIPIENNSRTIPLTLRTSTRIADLQVSLTAPRSPSPKGSPLTYLFTAKNAGPQDLNDVRMGVNVNPNVGALTFTGEGWTCNVAALDAVCSRPSMAAGAIAPLELKLTAPSVAGEVHVQARVFAVQAHVDPDPSNEREQPVTSIGDASNWSRILIPITETDIPGALGSLWKTELTGLIESTTPIVTEPTGCGGLEDPCQLPPRGKPFDLRRETLVWSGFPAQFIYVRKADAKKLVVSTRAYDASKNTETAGAFIPTARDDDFSPEGFSLIGVPVAPQFRTTLRVYDATANPDGRIQFALFGDNESLPFYMDAMRLQSDPDETTLTTALLPMHPSLAQIDLSAVIPAKYSRVRVQVVSDNSNVSLWGFISITNNETSHVTVITP